ncbi:hypothetical protein FRAAL4788 [Frankia alni ACN14a]|uniref:Uncharacterized protein n=1 Tax=Frankia alni (strain DSM 45986 / CECT 9034 / ACN14a) TaxID=326424 RepID=Q0RGF8_FRAAA|nr:hypothetical protein FRAAL4788 [Frankia alni ACN14a]
MRSDTGGTVSPPPTEIAGVSANVAFQFAIHGTGKACRHGDFDRMCEAEFSYGAPSAPWITFIER